MEEGKSTTHINNVLIKAVRDDDIRKVRKLIAFGADVNYRNEKNDTAVLLAKSVNILKLLIEKGAKYEYSHNIEYDDLYELGLYDNVHDFSKEIGSRKIYNNSTILNNYDYTQNPNLIQDIYDSHTELFDWMKIHGKEKTEEFFLKQFGFIKESGEQVNFTDIFDENRCDDTNCSYTKYTRNYILLNKGVILGKETIPSINKVNFYQDAGCRGSEEGKLTGINIFNTTNKEIKVSLASKFDPTRGEFSTLFTKKLCNNSVYFPSFNNTITNTNKYYASDNIRDTNILFNSNCNVEMTCEIMEKNTKGTYSSLHYCFIKKGDNEYIADSSIAKANMYVDNAYVSNILKHIGNIKDNVKKSVKEDNETKIIWINLLTKRLGDSAQALTALKDTNGCLITGDRMLVMLAIVYGVRYIIYCHPGLPSSVLIRKDMFTEKSKQQSVIRETAVIERSIPVGINIDTMKRQITELKKKIRYKYDDMLKYLYNEINKLNGGTNDEINNKYEQILAIMEKLILISTYYSKTIDIDISGRSGIYAKNKFAKETINLTDFYNNLESNYEKIKHIKSTDIYSIENINLFEKINLHNIGNKNASLSIIYGGYSILLKFFKNLINDEDKIIFDNLINTLCSIYDEYIKSSWKKNIICKRLVERLLYNKRYSGDDENIKCSFNSRVKPPMSGGGPTTNFFDLQEEFVSGLYLLNNISGMYDIDISGVYNDIFTPYFEYMSKKLSPEEYEKLEIFGGDEDPEKYYWIEPIKNTFVFINYIQYQMENYPAFLEIYNKLSTATEEDVDYFHTFLTALVPQLHTIMLQMLATDSEEPTTPTGSITSFVESTYTKTLSPTDTTSTKSESETTDVDMTKSTSHIVDADGNTTMYDRTGAGAAAGQGIRYTTAPIIDSPKKAPHMFKKVYDSTQSRVPKRKREYEYEDPSITHKYSRDADTMTDADTIKGPDTDTISVRSAITTDPLMGGKKKTKKHKRKKNKRTRRKRTNKKHKQHKQRKKTKKHKKSKRKRQTRKRKKGKKGRKT